MEDHTSPEGGRLEAPRLLRPKAEEVAEKKRLADRPDLAQRVAVVSSSLVDSHLAAGQPQFWKGKLNHKTQ